jgi:hypothetical protein
MEKSTPLSHLRRGDETQDADAMMDNIVSDIEGGGGGGYQGGGEEEFDPRMMQQQPGGPQQPMMQQHYPQQQQHPHPGVIYHQPAPPQMHMQRERDQSGGGGAAGLENVPFAQKLMHECKEPLLVSVLVVMLSSGQVVSLINRFLPMAQGNPLIGLAVRAIIAGIAFYLLRRFIPS